MLMMLQEFSETSSCYSLPMCIGYLVYIAIPLSFKNFVGLERWKLNGRLAKWSSLFNRINVCGFLLSS